MNVMPLNFLIKSRVFLVFLLFSTSFNSLLAEENVFSEVFQVAQSTNKASKTTQAKVDKTVKETDALNMQYKFKLKEIDGLKIFNAQQRQILTSQEDEISNLEASIQNIDVIQRQIVPLMLKMLDALEIFVQLDLPFKHEERKERVASLREMMNASDISASEKFAQILNAYQIENEYGRTIEAWDDKITIATQEGEQTLIVTMFRLGRLSLVYQTRDSERAGIWSAEQNGWVDLDDYYHADIRKAIRMARKQQTIDLINLPLFSSIRPDSGK